MDATPQEQERALFPAQLVTTIADELADKVDEALKIIEAPEAIIKGVAALHYLLQLQAATPEWEGLTPYEVELAAAVGAASWAALELAKI